MYTKTPFRSEVQDWDTRSLHTSSTETRSLHPSSAHSGPWEGKWPVEKATFEQTGCAGGLIMMYATLLHAALRRERARDGKQIFAARHRWPPRGTRSHESSVILRLAPVRPGAETSRRALLIKSRRWRRRVRDAMWLRGGRVGDGLNPLLNGG